MDGGKLWIAGCLGLTLTFIGPRLFAQAPELEHSWRDDAALQDVQMVSTRHGWAVGNHGALWQTADGGNSWTLAETGSSATFRSICLLTDEIGWVAGWQIRGSAELATGALLATRDGGVSWEAIDTKSLSPLRYVKFFGLEEGVVIGEPTPDNVTGVWSTADGGKSWLPLEGRPVRGWNAAALSSPEMGLLADREGNVSLLAGPQLLPSRLPLLKGRSIRGVSLANADHGWLVGDGGLVMHSPSGGVVWQSPESPLPEESRFVCDFRTVAVQGDAVWIAGNPGGVIWHSPDGGRRWIKQPTGVTTPINKLHFVNATHGCAVGELGMILVTQDGGETWAAAHGGNRHAAWMSIHARLDTVAPELIAKISGDQGYRGTALVAIRPPEARQSQSLGSDRLQEAVAASGGSAGDVAWPLTLDVPGLDLDGDKLIAYWQRRTEGQLPQTLLGQLVRQIRVWRPRVLIVEQPGPDDAAAQLIYDATLHAVAQAADGTRFVIHREFGGLTPWNVDRIYLKLAPGNTGEINLDPFELLPRWQINGRAAAAAPRALLNSEGTVSQRLTFRAIDRQGQPSPQSEGADFFTGLSLQPGSEVRRQLIPFDEKRLDQAIKTAQRHRNFISFADRALDDPRVAGQMIAQLRDVTSEMTPQQAAVTLNDLFLEYRQRSQDDFAEATAMELVHRFPDEPVAADAAKWLLPYLVSEEVAWQQRILSGGRKPPGSAPIRQVSRIQGPHGPRSDAMRSERLQKAQHVIRIIEERWPMLAGSPEIEFPLAALHRGRGAPNQADVVYRKRSSGMASGGLPWTAALQREIWLAQPAAEVPGGIARCSSTAAKPVLDGLLSDDCWMEAQSELLLSFRSSPLMPDDSSPLVMLAYDEEYLYIAASVPRIAGQSTDPVKTDGRQHDADLRRHDRVSIYLDIDRDYSTWYAFHVDQRGWTAESCWDNAGYNPQWFVAADGDSTHWRTEIAIPLSELSPRRPQPGEAWGVALERTAPGVGANRWQPADGAVSGAALGLLRFE